MNEQIMENQEVVAVAAEEIATTKSRTGLKVAFGVATGLIVFSVLHKVVVKPIIAKAKAKKEQKKADKVGYSESEPKMIFDEDGNPID